MMLLLAESNVIGWVGIACNAVIGFFLWGLSRTVQKYDRSDDDYKRQIELIREDAKADIKTLSGSLHEATDKLVDERIRRVSHEFANHGQQMMTTIDEIKASLKEGRTQFDGLSESDQQIEIRFLGCVDQLKDWMRDNAASKQDLKEHEKTVGHKFDQVGEKISTLSREVGVLADRTNR